MPSALTLVTAARRLRRGETTSVALVEESLEAIERHQPSTNAFIRVLADQAREAARAADRERREDGDRGPLHGLPISIKDIIDLEGVPTTAASRVMPDTPAVMDAPVMSRLRKAGAIIIGKTNLHEFALGTTNEDSAWGPVRNPADLERSSGGSSGGSAAAVATGMGLASIGTDTGGSVRIPAAACGLVGLKPTVGEISAAGVVPLSWTLDHVGPLTHTVDDAGVLWAVLTGRDWTVEEREDTGEHSTDARRFPSGSAPRLRQLGGYFTDLLQPEVRRAYAAAIDRLRDAGARLDDAVLEETETIQPVYADIALPEAAHWHRRHLRERAAAYTPNVRSRLEAGTTIPAVRYLAARDGRLRLERVVNRALDGCDALVLPTLPIVAPRVGEADVRIDPDRGEIIPVRAAMLRLTQLFNITGHPAITLPIAAPGLPVGLQLVGRLHQTAALLTLARACERIGLSGGQPAVREKE